MANVGFWTAISYGDQPKFYAQSFLETADDYFYFNGRKAYVIPAYTQEGVEGVVLNKDTPAITTFKVISYLTIIIPMAMLIVKAILRSTHTFHIINVKEKIEEGIELSKDTIAKIETLLNNTKRRESDSEVTWYNSVDRIFTLTSVPNLIFKQSDCNSRFANMVEAQTVCMAHQLERLITPSAKIFKVNEITIIAEQFIKIQPDESSQEKLYQELSDLDETVKQLAIFIAKTGFNDVTWRNIPIVDDPVGQGPRRVALIDLQDMGIPEDGIFGNPLYKRRGLIGCLFSETHIDIALVTAERYGIASIDLPPSELKRYRMQEVQEYRELQEFYIKNKILDNPRKPVQIDDLTTLELPLQKQSSYRNYDENTKTVKEQFVTYKEVIEYVITQINTQINSAPVEASVKGTRHIFFNTTEGILNRYDHTGLSDEEIVHMSCAERSTCSYLGTTVRSLVAKGYLFKITTINQRGYFVQA